MSNKPAQVFSVYDYRTRDYKYFAAPLGNVPASGAYRSPRGNLAEGLLPSLPKGATPIGDGALPQGVIATDNALVVSNETTSRLLKAALGVAALVAYLWWQKRKAKQK